MNLSWQQVQQEFEFDGSWRDLYAFHTTLDDWQKLLDFLHGSRLNIEFSSDGETRVLSNDAAECFQLARESSCLCTIRFSGVAVKCHFFQVEEIEFDLDPREIVGQDELDNLFAFMRAIANVLEKDIVLTPENAPSYVIFRAVPRQLAITYDPHC
jgi:hypothetical protein